METQLSLCVCVCVSLLLVYTCIIFSSPVILWSSLVLFLTPSILSYPPPSLTLIFYSSMSCIHLLYSICFLPLPALYDHSLSLHSSVNRFSLDLSSTKTRQCPVEYTHSRQGTAGYGSIARRRLVDPMAIHCYYSPENNRLKQTGSHRTIRWNIWLTCMDTHMRAQTPR